MKNIIFSAVVGSSFFMVAITAAAVSGSLFPTSEGSYLQWTPKSGSTHYTMVDEVTCNGTTDYVYTSVVGAKDSYSVNLSSIPNGAQITKMELVPCGSRNSSGSGSANLGTFYRFNGVDSAYVVQALSGTTPVKLSTTSFSNLSLQKTASSTLQIGGVYYSGTKGARLSHISARLTYETLPADPSSLTATSTMVSSSPAVFLAWTDNSNNETGFKIERSTDGINYSQITTTTVGATSFTDRNPIAGSVNYYRVRAFNSVGNSGYTNVVSVSYLLTLPLSPSNLSAYSINASGTRYVFLAWNDNSNNELDFRIERSLDAVNYSEIQINSANVRTFNDFNVSTGTTYYYKVRAHNDAGYSNYSNTASSTVQ